MLKQAIFHVYEYICIAEGRQGVTDTGATWPDVGDTDLGYDWEVCNWMEESFDTHHHHGGSKS